MVGVERHGLGRHIDDHGGDGHAARRGQEELHALLDLLDIGNLLGREGQDHLGVVLTVGIGSRDVHGLLLAHLHIDHGGIKALDHLAGTTGELQRLAAIVGAIELRAVVERAAVMGLDLLALVGHGNLRDRGGANTSRHEHMALTIP